MKFAFFEYYDQVHFWPVFVPGQPKNSPTRRTSPLISHLVGLKTSRIIIRVLRQPAH